MPDLADLPPLDALAPNPAVSLFCERAQAVNSHFALTAKNMVAVAALCVRLDGLPLAIELAAARSKLLDPQTLLTHLHHRLALLTHGAGDWPAHHQTLKAAIDWSYRLLPRHAQILFARLSIFVGGCTLAAIETVCGQTPGEVAIFDCALLDELQSLMDASLVQVQGQADEQRIMLLETLREHYLYVSVSVTKTNDRACTLALDLLDKFATAMTKLPPGTLTPAEMSAYIDREILITEANQVAATLRLTTQIEDLASASATLATWLAQ